MPLRFGLIKSFKPGVDGIVRSGRSLRRLKLLRFFGGSCQANDKLTYLNERQIDLPVDVRFLRFFGSQRGVQRADGCELP